MFIHVGDYLFREADVRLVDMNPLTKSLTVSLAGMSEPTIFLKDRDYETYRAWVLGQITGLVRDVPGLGPVRDLDPPDVEEVHYQDAPLNIPDGSPKVSDFKMV